MNLHSGCFLTFQPAFAADPEKSADPLLLCADVRHNAEGEMKKESGKNFRILFWWREEDSNLRPLGYEPNELPLLHPAMYRFYRCKGSEFSDTVQ